MRHVLYNHHMLFNPVATTMATTVPIKDSKSPPHVRHNVGLEILLYSIVEYVSSTSLDS